MFRLCLICEASRRANGTKKFMKILSFLAYREAQGEIGPLHGSCMTLVLHINSKLAMNEILLGRGDKPKHPSSTFIQGT